MKWKKLQPGLVVPVGKSHVRKSLVEDRRGDNAYFGGRYATPPGRVLRGPKVRTPHTAGKSSYQGAGTAGKGRQFPPKRRRINGVAEEAARRLKKSKR